MKRILSVVGVVLLAALLMLPAGAQAEMFLEGYLGGVFPANSPDCALVKTNPDHSATWAERIRMPGHIDPAFQGGLKLGAWFDKTGVLSGINFPSWMKYLGFYLDLSYHNLNFPKRASHVDNPFWSTKMYFTSAGGAATLAFMFAYRYGFLPTQEVPFGRLQPYIAVGPAIFWSWQTPRFGWPDGYDKCDSRSNTNIALAVETGLRWMALKNVSLDISFKYRYAHPTYIYDRYWGPGSHYYFKAFPNLNLFSLQVGAAYHF